MNIGKLGWVYHAIVRWAEGEAPLAEVASYLDMKLADLDHLFLVNGLINAHGEPAYCVTAQEVLFILTLYYAMKPTEKFTKTVIG